MLDPGGFTVAILGNTHKNSMFLKWKAICQISVTNKWIDHTAIGIIFIKKKKKCNAIFYTQLYTLENFNSFYQLESISIYASLNYIIPHYSKVAMVSDSISVMEALKNPYPSSYLI